MLELEKLNAIEMIGCTKAVFDRVLKNAIGKVTVSSGSWYSDFLLLDSKGVLARFNHKGALQENR